MTSWFSSFNYTDAMLDGTLNKNPTFDNLESEYFIQHLFELGFLFYKDELSIGLSPDGIVLIEVDDDSS